MGIGALVLAAVLGTIRFFWYPGFYFEVQDAGRTLPVLAVVCLVFGPLLTLLVFKPGKQGLRFDLTVIALLQIGALAFGLHRLYAERPYFMVYAVDRFFVVSPREVDVGAAKAAGFTKRSLIGPGLAVARVPADPAARSRLTREVLMEGKPDIEHRPEFWTRYDAAIDDIRNVAPALSLLRERRPDLAGAIDRLVEDSGAPLTELLFVSALGPTIEYAVVVRKSDGFIEGAVGLDDRN
jgi:hypothetical protein